MSADAAGDTELPSASQSARKTATWVPHDLKYDAAFEDALMHVVLDANSAPVGLKVLASDDNETPIESVSIREVDTASMLPEIEENELPLSLSDPRRVFRSAVPGVKLTHPSGYIEGGPGLDPEIDTYSDDFLNSHPGISSADQLQQAIDQEVQSSLDLLKQRMRARQAAKEKNELIEKDLRSLTDQHNMELKIQRRMLEEHEAKKQAKERKRKEREGG